MGLPTAYPGEGSLAVSPCLVGESGPVRGELNMLNLALERNLLPGVEIFISFCRAELLYCKECVI